jgi:hypothetical protein
MRALVVASLALPLLLASGGCAPNAGLGVSGGLDGGGIGHRARKRSMSAEAFRPTGLVTLALDGRSMRNAPVRVRGLLSPASGERVTLRDPGGQRGAAVIANIRNLEPAEKEWIASRCAASCEAEILGVVQAPLGTSTFYIDAYFLGDMLPQPG